jgi:SAM-dependent methyltransferase
MSPMDPARIVQEGYDLLDGTVRNWVATMHEGPRRSSLTGALERIPPGCDVLEVGCGPGTDAVALSAGRRRYTGIDLSAVQLGHARVPNGTFLHADVLEVQLPPASFDAVVALYVFGHIPAARTGELFARIHGWLCPGGWLCASFGPSDNPGEVEERWLGVADMYFSSLPPEQTDAMLRSAGFDIRSSETVEEIEPGESTVAFRWVIARRSEASRRSSGRSETDA